jgi:hypothetical protein
MGRGPSNAEREERDRLKSLEREDKRLPIRVDGTLTMSGLRLLARSGELPPGALFCPPTPCMACGSHHRLVGSIVCPACAPALAFASLLPKTKAKGKR